LQPLQTQQVAEADDITFEVNIEHVSGVPVEHESRRPDLLHKGIRFAICRTDNPPTEDSSGTRPEFLSNVVKLHATPHPKYQDKLVFTNAGDRDASASCFVRCNNKFRGSVNPSNILPQDKLKSAAAEINRSRDPALPMLTPNADITEEQQNVDVLKSHSTANANKSRPVSTNLSNTRQTTAVGVMQLYLFVEMTSSFRLPVYEENEQEMKERLESRRDRQQQFINNNKRKASTGVKRESSSMLGFLSRVNEGSTDNLSVDNEGNSSPAKSPGRNASKLKSTKVSGPVETIEMCAAWAMIPISELTASSAVTTAAASKPFVMHGGTPFMNVNIRDKDIIMRSGTWQALKRSMGYQVKPKLSVVITPPSSASSGGSSSSVSAGRPSSVRMSGSFSSMSPAKPVQTPAAAPGPAAGVSTVAGTLSPYSPAPGREKPIKEDDTKLITLLPPQLLLPTHGVTLVGIYRAMLKDSLRIKLDEPDRVLPQSGVTVHQDVILGSFPKILADPATCSVLLKLWSKEAPDTLTNKKLGLITVTDISSRRVLDTFHDVVLKLYRTLHCLEAQPDKFNPFETLESLYRREELIRKLCGLTPVGGGGPARGGVSASISGNLNAAAAADDSIDVTQVLYAPFNCKELHWKR
jgi:hypothetical protein